METQKQIYLLLSYIAEGQVNMKFYYPQLPSFPLENFLVDMYPRISRRFHFILPTISSGGEFILYAQLLFSLK